MAIGVFPALKLGVLFVKQISKPLAKFLVSQAKNHPVFRTYFIIPPAQFYHWAEVKTKMYVMNLGKPTKVAKLNEAMAMELGANLMGEVIIFSVAGSCLILEYNRQVAKEAKKEEARLQQIQQFTDDISSLHQVAARQDQEIQYLQSAIVELSKKSNLELPARYMPPETNNHDSRLQPAEGKADATAKQDTRDTENPQRSVVQRALVYYENNVKVDRLR